jgi:hypothetical protein
VTDKNTLNGTYLNGNLIPKGPCRLQHGDVVAFGGPANVSFPHPCDRCALPSCTLEMRCGSPPPSPKVVQLTLSFPGTPPPISFSPPFFPCTLSGSERQ